jgi:hypothetical protein
MSSQAPPKSRSRTKKFCVTLATAFMGLAISFTPIAMSATPPLKMIIVYTPAGFEQSFVDQAAMLQEGKDQSEISRMMLERYGLTRKLA